jgi:hypothetical protein
MIHPIHGKGAGGKSASSAKARNSFAAKMISPKVEAF